MTTFTAADMQAVGIAGSTNEPALSGPFTIEWIIDGAKKAIAQNDIVELLVLPAYAGAIINAASVTTLAGGTASGAPEIGIAGTAITGLTGFDSATANARAVKYATGANTVIAGASAQAITYKQLTAGLGSGKLRIRVQGVYVPSFA